MPKILIPLHQILLEKPYNTNFLFAFLIAIAIGKIVKDWTKAFITTIQKCCAKAD